MEPLFLMPNFKEKIWGGTNLHRMFGYTLPSDQIGECWAISGHFKGPSIIASGFYEGVELSVLWDTNPQLFGFSNQKYAHFPLLAKIIDANKNLSVQVHPDDKYVKQNKLGEFGKTECWYVLDCKADAEIILGHRARNLSEFKEKMENQNWKGLLHTVKISAGDFYYVPSGTVHALCEGTVVLEIQQTSDLTYRLYDYNRIDQSGCTRELHLNEALEVMKVPHESVQTSPKVLRKGKSIVTTLIEEQYFSVYKWEVDDSLSIMHDNKFLICSAIQGSGVICHNEKSYSFKSGDHFILPFQFGLFELKGNCTIIAAHT